MSNNSQLGPVKTGYNCTVTGRGYDWVANVCATDVTGFSLFWSGF